jgi:hypothetical protein
MKWIADTVLPRPLHFVIEQAVVDNISDNIKETWFYLYVYENGVDIGDYQQETLDIAKEFARRKFNVPLDAWRIV